uniref:ABC transmembrane type-1 domain-containing protein n=1 Tax=Oryza glumipatula TaxID=40148 RepID=A0A0E0BQK5_9ORYZ
MVTDASRGIVVVPNTSFASNDDSVVADSTVYSARGHDAGDGGRAMVRYSDTKAVAAAASRKITCWRIIGERSVLRMRREYLEAVLRQEIGFFDTEVSTGEVIWVPRNPLDPT